MPVWGSFAGGWNGFFGGIRDMETDIAVEQEQREMYEYVSNL